MINFLIAFAKNQTRLAYEDKRDLYSNDYLISLLVNFPCEMGQIMNRYDFLESR